jgi:hypothetical protein
MARLLLISIEGIFISGGQDLTTVDNYISSISSQLQLLQRTVAGARSSSTSASITSFLATLRSFDTAASQAISAFSAGGSQSSADSTASSTQQTSTNTATPTIAASTMSALLEAAGSEQASSSTTTSGIAHLLPAGSSPDTANMPSMATFMAATGADASTASDVLYGTIGSNTDLRDWGAIMSSSNPLADARASTGAMYNSTLNYVSPDASQPSATDVLGTSGNFEYVTSHDGGPSSRLIITDGQGNQLTAPSNPTSLSQLTLNFGFDSSALSTLQSQLVS